MTIVRHTAPTEWHHNGDRPSIFLAGGITGCDDWQSNAIRHFDGLGGFSAVVLNPRRPDFDVNDPNAEDAQIEWEFRHLHRVDLILFWFPKSESVQPIAQYELGRYGKDKQIAVGTDLEYKRARDVRKQLRLARPDVRVYDNLLDTCREARVLLSR